MKVSHNPLVKLLVKLRMKWADARGHHGGHDPLQQEFALYYFGDANYCGDAEMLSQLQLAPTVLNLMGAEIPSTMQHSPFLQIS